MAMTGSQGAYLPEVTGGTNSQTVSFSAAVIAGANGSYNINDLTDIVQVVYTVADQTIAVTTSGFTTIN